MIIETKRTDNYYYTRVEVPVVPNRDIPLVPLGDFHYGSPHCLVDDIKKTVQWIKEKGALWIGMGDYIEMGTKTSVGAGVYEQILKPQDQIEGVVDLLDPIKDTCICLLKGNHEERSHKAVGIDPAMVIASELGVSYSGWESWGAISNNHAAYTFHAVHGGSGHKNAALLMNMMDRDMRKFISTDLIFRAHSHDRITMSCEVIDVISSAHSVRIREQLLVGTGHFLGRAESYAAAKSLAPKPSGTIAIWLRFTKTGRKLMRPEYV